MRKKEPKKSKAKKEKDPATIAREELKMEVAAELGLLEKIEQDGWGGLSATEAGRIGGIVAARLKTEG